MAKKKASRKKPMVLKQKVEFDKKVLASKIGWVAKDAKSVLGWRYYGDGDNVLEFYTDVEKKRGKVGKNFNKSEWPPKKVRVVVYDE